MRVRKEGVETHKMAVADSILAVYSRILYEYSVLNQRFLAAPCLRAKVVHFLGDSNFVPGWTFFKSQSLEELRSVYNSYDFKILFISRELFYMTARENFRVLYLRHFLIRIFNFKVYRFVHLWLLR